MKEQPPRWLDQVYRRGGGYREHLAVAVAAALEAGALLRSARRDGYSVRPKQGAELTTNADEASEAAIVDRIKQDFPKHAYLGEESHAIEAGSTPEDLWIIDPLDGTANFIYSHDHAAVSIAYARNGVVEVGVVAAPFRRELFVGLRNEGSYVNGRRLHVNPATQIADALVGTGFPHVRDNVEPAVETVRRLVSHCRDIRRLAAPSLDICWVAQGKLDAHCESLMPWDVAAAGLVAREAGAVTGRVSVCPATLPSDLEGDSYLAAAPGIYEELRMLLL